MKGMWTLEAVSFAEEKEVKSKPRSVQKGPRRHRSCGEGPWTGARLQARGSRQRRLLVAPPRPAAAGGGGPGAPALPTRPNSPRA